MRGSFVGTSVFLIMSIAATRVAYAQQPSSSASADADRLFREAMAAQQKGRYAEACTKLVESDRLDRAPGTEYNLGLCYELTRRPASARRAYLQAAELASATNKSKLANDARARAQKLERRVPRIVLRPAESATKATLTIDEAVVESQSRTDVVVEVDPGTHRIRATAEGRAPFESVVDLVEGQRAEIMIALDATDGFVRSVPALTKDATSGEQLSDTGAGAANPASSRRESTPSSSSSTDQRTSTSTFTSASASTPTPTLAYVGLAVGGVGVVALGAAAFFTLSARDGRDDSRCIDGRFCPDEASASRLREAKSDADLATVFAISGAALAVAGVAMFFFAPRTRGSVAAKIRGVGFAGAF